MFFNSRLVLGLLALSVLPFAAHAGSAELVLDKGPTRPIRPASKLPAQSKVARHGAFATISASDPALRGAIAATNLPKVRANMNRNVRVVGTVVKVYISKSNAHVLLDFALNYKTAVVGLVDAKNFKQFPDLRALAGKRVFASGRIVSMKDQTQIDITNLASLRIVK